MQYPNSGPAALPPDETSARRFEADLEDFSDSSSVAVPTAKVQRCPQALHATVQSHGLRLRKDKIWTEGREEVSRMVSLKNN